MTSHLQTENPQTQKEMAEILDLYAERACHVSATPATRKQVWFLSSLLLKEGHNAYSATGCDTNFILTKKTASAIISGLLN